MSESNFDLDDTMEWGEAESDDASLNTPRSIGVRVVCSNSWGTSDPFEPDPVPLDPENWLAPHPSLAGAEPATAQEADAFWREGGWDE